MRREVWALGLGLLKGKNISKTLTSGKTVNFDISRGIENNSCACACAPSLSLSLSQIRLRGFGREREKEKGGKSTQLNSHPFLARFSFLFNPSNLKSNLSLLP